MRSNFASSTMSLSRVISCGPKVSGRLAPIFTPVQPLSLCEAVTIATQGTSSSNCAKYAIGVMQSPMSCTLQPDASSPVISAIFTEAEYERKSWPVTISGLTPISRISVPSPMPSASMPIRLISFSSSQRASYSRKPVGFTSGLDSYS